MPLERFQEYEFGGVPTASSGGGGGSGEVTSVNGKSGVVVIGKADIGLSQVDNTRDTDKPISRDTQTALNGKQPTGDYALKSDIPTQLPNPNTITINGTPYDGSKAVELTIEGGGGGIPEAPKDSKTYGRNNGAWTAVTSGGESYDDTQVRQLIENNANAIQNNTQAIEAIDIPSKLPNPFALTINGTPYDGSKAVGLTISGGSGGGSTSIATPSVAGTLYAGYDTENNSMYFGNTPFEIPQAGSGEGSTVQFEAGGLGASGESVNSSTKARTPLIEMVREVHFNDDVYKMGYNSYDESGKMVGSIGALQTTSPLIVSSSHPQCRLQVQKQNAFPMAQSDIDDLSANTRVYYVSDVPVTPSKDTVLFNEVPVANLGVADGVSFGEQTLTKEQQEQLARNTGFPLTDTYTTWKQGKKMSGGVEADGNLYYGLSALIDWSPTLVIPEPYSVTTISYFDSDGVWISNKTAGDTKGVYAIPKLGDKIRITLWDGSYAEFKEEVANKGAYLRKDYNVVATQTPQYVREEQNHVSRALACKCAFENNSSQTNMPNMAFGFLWFNKDDNGIHKFYVSDSYHSEKKYVFTWDLELSPDYYSFASVNNGDLLAVYRCHSDLQSPLVLRQNPHFFKRSAGYQRTEIDMSKNASLNGVKPNAWISNQGFTRDNDRNAYYIGEYSEFNIEYGKVFLWKITGTPENPNNWKIIQEHTLSGDVNMGMRHFHVAQIDPFTGYLYATTGDDDANSKIFVSTDEGATVTLAHGPSESECRLLNFIFHEDYVYWATDSGIESKHKFFRAQRNAETKILDGTTLEELHHFHFDGYGIATYAAIDMKALNCIVFLGRADVYNPNPNPIYIWDFEDNTMKVAGTPSHGAFRCQYYHLNPTDNRILVGWDWIQLARGVFPNGHDLLGNFFGQIANFVITINRVGTKFTYTFDCVK